VFTVAIDVAWFESSRVVIEFSRANSRLLKRCSIVIFGN
jgi:hypothetical protein